MAASDVHTYQMPCSYGLDNASERMDEERAMMNKAMSVEDTLEQRGSVYGEWSEQLECVTSIVAAMTNCQRANNAGVTPSQELIAEWHYLAIKIARIAANPHHTDSYHDLAGYATLMERERMQ